MNPVSAAHLHLILCHVPVLGVLFGLGWLAFGVWRGSQDIQKVALATFVIAAILAVPTYLTGDPAAGALKGLPGFSGQILERHEAAAGFALAGFIVLGILALAGLILFRGQSVVRWFGLLLLAAALLVACLVLWTANIGGQIRHSEIRAYDAQSDQ